MKIIIYNNRVFQYEIVDNYYFNPATIFYEGFITKHRLKYLFFGPKITKYKPKFVFDLFSNIESPNITKEDIIKLIKTNVDILNRKEEIKNGIII